MQQNGFMSMLRSALAQAEAHGKLPPGVFPTLPVVEATEFGQQQLVTTFYVGTPPPALIVAQGGYVPALTLHCILPEGYLYWQPETGTRHYVGGEQRIENVPEPYQEVLRACVRRLLLGPKPKYPLAQLSSYLVLLEKIADKQWLLGKNADPVAERAAAVRLQQHLQQLCKPELAAYYQGRGQALQAWIARVTYVESWVEKALAAVSGTVPDWAVSPAKSTALRAAAPVPAVLDGRRCIVVGYYHAAPAADEKTVLYPPHAACYASFPDLETQWRALRGEEHFALFALPHDEQGRPCLGEEKPALTPSTNQAASALSYQRLVSLLLERGWLLPHLPVTTEEKEAALALREATDVIFSSPLGK